MTNVSTLGQAHNQIDRFSEQQLLLNTLSNQLATGRKTQVFSGLDINVIADKRARADLSSIQTYINNIDNADRRMQLTLNTIEEFQEQAENFSAALFGFSQESAHQQGDPVYFDDPLTPVTENTIIGFSSADPDVDLQTLQDLANNLYNYAVDLLNTKDGDRFLLSGSDTSTAPIIDTGVLDSALSVKLNDWKGGTLTTDDLIADLQDSDTTGGNTDALTDTVVGYSSTLSADTAGRVYARVSDSTEVDFTVFGDDQGFRDVLVALSYFKSADLGPIVDQVEIDATTGLPNVLTQGAPGADADESKENFYTVFNMLSAMVSDAIDAIDQQRFRVESARAQIDQIKSNYQQEQNLLQATIDEIENVDINEVAVQINQLQVQLEASYGVTARVSQLSLVNFL